MSAFPTSISPKTVKVRPVWAVAEFDNPIDLSSEVQALGGFRFEIDVEMQPMPASAAADFGAFIQGLQGGTETFTFNLTPWCPGWSPAPGNRTFRLASPDAGWDAELAIEFGFAFTAIEDI